MYHWACYSGYLTENYYLCSLCGVLYGGHTQLTSAPAFKQLRIFCAGVWHNFVLAILALSLLTNLPCMD